MKQNAQELYTFWRIVKHCPHISSSTFHQDLCAECVEVKFLDGQQCTWTKFQLQLTAQNVLEVHPIDVMV